MNVVRLRFPRGRLQSRRPSRKPSRGYGLAVVVFLGVFAFTTWITAPAAPGRAAAAAFVEARLTDRYFVNCSDARARGRQSIPRTDPSYRKRMDADRDGLACEPYP